MVPVGTALQTAGVDALSVVGAADAIQLRQAGIQIPILLYGGNLANQALLDAVIRYRLTATIHDDMSASLFASSPSPIDALVKIAVGNERFGLCPEEMDGLAARLRAAPNCRIGGVYAHPDVPSNAQSSASLEWQLARLADAAARLNARGVPVALRMAASSRVILARSDMALEAIDPGHLFFGIDAGVENRTHLPLKPALIGLFTQVVQVRSIADTPYRQVGPVPERKTTRIAVLPLGFADGFNRCNAGHVLIGGQVAPIIPRYSAEHTRIDISALPQVNVGDEVAVIGRQRNVHISIADVVCHQKQLRPIELTMGFHPSIPRLYRTISSG